MQPEAIQLQVTQRAQHFKAMIKMRKLTTRSSFYDYAEAMNQREPFKTSGALRGETGFKGEIRSSGHLPSVYRPSLVRADYVIYSYGTPIAWHDVLEGWLIPDVSYSVTTTRHQNKIRTAIHVL